MDHSSRILPKLAGLVEYAGYEEFGDETHYELYKVDEYPEELEDLIKSHPGVADDL